MKPQTPPPQQLQTKFVIPQQTGAADALRVEFIINTYPDLQPFLEMAVVLLEGVYEHKRISDQKTEN